MSDDRYKWAVGVVLLAMLADTVSPHPMLDAKSEYRQQEGVIPQPVLGFANERQWLFAHREFRNQCVLEALAEQRKRSGKPLQFVSARLGDAISVTDLRLRPND